MSNSDAISGGSVNADLDTVAMVYGEVERVLKQLQSALRMRVHERAQGKGSTGSSADQSSLQDIQRRLHQSEGALELVNIPAAVQMLVAINGAVQQFTDRPDALNADNVNKVDRACFALLDFFQLLLNGKPVYPVGLFAQYRDVAEISKLNVQPSDLWSFNWQWTDVALPAANQVNEQELESALSRVDKVMLGLLRGNLDTAKDFRTIALGLAYSPKDERSGQFWALVAGFFDGIATQSIPLNIYTKRAASQVLNIHKSYTQGQMEVPEQFVKTLLFFCVPQQQGAGPATQAHPVLTAVRQAYHLDQVKIVNYDAPLYGRIDPALITLARKRIAAAKLVWSSLSSGEPIPAQSVTEAFENVSESLQQIMPGSTHFAQALLQAVSQIASRGQMPSPELALEVATAVLYVEALFSDLDLNDANSESRFNRLTERMLLVAKGGKPLPLDAWIEDLYRQVNDRETMGSVVGELRTLLGKAEGNIDGFLRNTQNSQAMSQAGMDLRQIHGVLSVLGLDEAARATLMMEGQVNWLLKNESAVSEQIDEQRKSQISSLSNSLGALGFLIDMLGYQPLVARKMFVYDAEHNEFKFLMGRDRATEQDTAALAQEAPAADEVHEVQPDAPESFEQEATATEPEAEVTLEEQDEFSDTDQLTTEELSMGLIEDAQTAPPAAAPQDEHQADEAEATIDFPEDAPQEELSVVEALPDEPVVEAPPAPQVISAPLPEETSSHEDEDDFGDDLREIFLEEAQEVIETARAELEKLNHNLTDHEALVTVRRSFHTLKGSSRMVGLTEFGSAAWACEQCFNEWIAENQPIPHKLVDFANWAFDQFASWVDDLLQGKGDGNWQAAVFEEKAEAEKVAGAIAEKEAAPAEEMAASVAEHSESTDEQPTVVELESFDEPTVTPVDTAEEEASIVTDSQPPQDWASTQPISYEEQEEILAQPMAVPEERVEAPSSAATFDNGIDFADESTSPVAKDEQPASEPSTQELSATIEPLVEPEDTLQVDEDSAVPVKAEDVVAASVPEPVAEPQLEVHEPVVASLAEPLPTDAVTAETPTESAAEAQQYVAAEPVSEPEHAVQTIKVVAGGIEVNEALYHLYIDEASARIELLEASLGRWHSEGDPYALEQAQTSARALAGSSATVGFLGLSSFARDLERALEHYRLTALRAGVPEDRSATQVLERICLEFRRLLDQFIHGRLDIPHTDLIVALYQFKQTNFEAVQGAVAEKQPVHEHASSAVVATDDVESMPIEHVAEVPQSHQHEVEEPLTVTDADLADDSIDVSVSEEEQPADAFDEDGEDSIIVDESSDVQAADDAESDVEVVEEIAPEDSAEEIVVDEPADEQDAEVVTVTDTVDVSDVATAPIVESASDLTKVDPQEIDIVGTELFAFFRNEATGLLSRVEQGLKTCAQTGAGDSLLDVRRALHTFKGSARLAGAMRLGNMVQALEPVVNQLSERQPMDSGLLEGALHQLDAVRAEFDLLCQAADQVSESAAPSVSGAEQQQSVDEVRLAYARLNPEDRAAVGTDLFDIFKEETQDLLPRISSGLREWSDEPDDHAPLIEVLRALHTLKGSSRLAGAMHLGNMTHELETALKNVNEQQQGASEQVQDVLGRLDDIETEFDTLCDAAVEVAQGVVDLHAAAPADSSAAPQPVQPAVVEPVTAPAQQVAEPVKAAPAQKASDAVAATSGIPVDSAVYRLDPQDCAAVTTDLFAIFKEETNELLPAIESGLRHWAESPKSSRLVEALRALHTLKGSSRLTGAKRLGKMVHALESTLKIMENQQPSDEEFNSIHDQFIQIEGEFDLLCKAEQEIRSGQVLPPVNQPDAAQDADILPLVTEVASTSALYPLEATDRDAVGAEIFTFFGKEAQRLTPVIAEKLDPWAQSPDSGLPLVEVLRALNTLRDNIHLSGIGRLGALTQELNASLKELIGTTPEVDQIGHVIDQFNEVELELDRLYRASAEVRHQTYRPVPLYAEQLMQKLFGQSVAEMHDVLEKEHSSKIVEAKSVPDQVTPEVEPVKAEPVKAEEIPAPVVEDVTLADQPKVMPRAIKPTAARAVGIVSSGQLLRVKASLIDELVNKAGEVNMLRSQLAAEVRQLKDVLLQELSTNLERLRVQLRDVELQAETQLASRMESARVEGHGFDPLEFDRYTRIQELTRIMAESVNDVGTVQKTLLHAATTVEDGLAAQSRSARDLQRTLLRARMVEFLSIGERFHRVVRLTSKECQKQTQLNIIGGEIEVDRAVLDHIAPAFEHILRNCIVHGIEPAEKRKALGKTAVGQITIKLAQEGNDVSISISDDGSGLDLQKIRKKAESMNLIEPGSSVSDYDLAQMIYKAGLTTADKVSELAGRGVGLDMAHAEIIGLGGRVEVLTQPHEGTEFRMVMPLTTAVTQVVMVSVAGKTFGIPVNLIESIQRFSDPVVGDAVRRGKVSYLDMEIPAYWLGGLLNLAGTTPFKLGERKLQWLVLRSAGQQVAIAVDHIIGSQEVVIKNVGPQFAHLTGFSGLTVLSGGRIILIYNPVALARSFGDNGQLSAIVQVPQDMVIPADVTASEVGSSGAVAALEEAETSRTPHSNKVLVVDDSLTVRRVTQRLLERAGFEVALAKDGQDALNQIQAEIPALVLSDIEMPRMDGFELVRRLRSHSETQMLPVIMITSRIAQKHHDYANELGVSHYLGKPYVEEELLKLVHRYVKQQSSIIH
ncbi:MAG: Sensor histidine kinase RcsC [Saezia sanguinis]